VERCAALGTEARRRQLIIAGSMANEGELTAPVSDRRLEIMVHLKHAVAKVSDVS